MKDKHPMQLSFFVKMSIFASLILTNSCAIPGTNINLYEGLTKPESDISVVDLKGIYVADVINLNNEKSIWPKDKYNTSNTLSLNIIPGKYEILIKSPFQKDIGSERKLSLLAEKGHKYSLRYRVATVTSEGIPISGWVFLWDDTINREARES
jgi:hypothetical protein